jgi:hypothetical protein
LHYLDSVGFFILGGLIKEADKPFVPTAVRSIRANFSACGKDFPQNGIRKIALGLAAREKPR